MKDSAHVPGFFDFRNLQELKFLLPTVLATPTKEKMDGPGAVFVSTQRERPEAWRWYCDICAQAFDSPEQKAQHLSGKKHIVNREKGKRVVYVPMQKEEGMWWGTVRRYLKAERQRADQLYITQEKQLTLLQYLDELLFEMEERNRTQESSHPPKSCGKEAEDNKLSVETVQAYGVINPLHVPQNLKETLLKRAFSTLEANNIQRDQVQMTRDSPQSSGVIGINWYYLNEHATIGAKHIPLGLSMVGHSRLAIRL